MVTRTLQTVLDGYMFKGKAIILIGARQVGKTTLLKQLTKNRNENILWLNCDNQTTIESLSNNSLQSLRLLIKDNKIVVVDEAQRVPGIGLTLKLITDNFPDVQLLVTGSSSLDLHNKLDEPLTGRKIEYNLYPISTDEIYNAEGLIPVKERMPQRLIYGSYPDVMFGTLNPEKALMELSNSYLYKDVLEFDGLKKSTMLYKLLTALASQIGGEISINQISNIVGLNNRTVEKYIDILEKCHIVFRLGSFSRNIRTELSKSKKIYFYDLGVRNAVLNNFSPLDKRSDIGSMWENFFIAERIKYNQYNDRYVNSYFWRTTDKQEIDYIEEYNGELHLFEMKWNNNKSNTKVSNLFVKTYNPSETNIITPANYLDFLI